MPKVMFEGLIKGFRGKIGDLIYRLMPDGSTVVSHAPHEHKPDFSEGQLNHQNRFQQAAFYARQAAQDQPIYAELAVATTMRTTYNFGVSDWWHPPVIHRMERVEGRILVEASDDVMVTNMRVTILDNENDGSAVLESGEATRGDGNWWVFASDTHGKTIIAEAWDLPGHVTRFVAPYSSV